MDGGTRLICPHSARCSAVSGNGPPVHIATTRDHQKQLCQAGEGRPTRVHTAWGHPRKLQKTKINSQRQKADGERHGQQKHLQDLRDKQCLGTHYCAELHVLGTPTSVTSVKLDLPSQTWPVVRSCSVPRGIRCWKLGLLDGGQSKCARRGLWLTGSYALRREAGPESVAPWMATCPSVLHVLPPPGASRTDTLISTELMLSPCP